jgi:hypothetical protein
MLNCFSGLGLYLTLKALRLNYNKIPAPKARTSQRAYSLVYIVAITTMVYERAHKPLTMVGVATNM